jgi:hypothetical protein
VTDDRELPPAVEAWVRQLLDDQFIQLIREQPYERIDVRLTASRGKVSRLPQIVLNGGQQEFVEATRESG